MKRMKRVKRYVRSHWKIISFVGLSAAVVAFIMLYRLGSLTGGISTAELQQRAFAGNWHHIIHDPLNAPLTSLEWLCLAISSHQGQTLTRLASTVFGVLALVSFAYVLRRWYGVRTALFGTVLFGLSSWFLHVSRFAGPEVLYLWAVPTLLATHIAWERYSKRPFTTFIAIAVLAILLYIPGMFWLVLLSLTMQSHHLIDGWRQLKQIWQRVGLVALFVVLMAPLGVALIHTPTLIQDWLGLPQTFSDPGEVPRRFAQTIGILIWRGPKQPQLWLDRIPVLDVFSGIMGLLGTVFYARHIAAPRTRLLVSMYVIGAIFYSLGGSVSFSMLIPIIYLVIAAGVGYLLHEWLHVFPRNPLARSIGFGLLGLAISLACVYNVRAYFVAWPHNETTIATFKTRLRS
jgi:hypothetical protein